MNIESRKKFRFTHFPTPYATTFPALFREAIAEPDELLIKAAFSPPPFRGMDFETFIAFINHGIKNILPQDLLRKIKEAKNQVEKRHCLKHLDDLLPLFSWSDALHSPCSLYINMLCPSEATQGVGRYVSETVSRWLIPGKLVNLCSAQSLNFQFLNLPECKFFFHQVVMQIEDERDLVIIRNNLPEITAQLRLNISAVKNARRIVAMHLSAEEKTVMIQENIAALINRPDKEFNLNVFDQMQQFLIKLSAEEKIASIKDNFAPLLKKRPNFFELNMFYEIQSFVLLFGGHFTASRDLKHLGRLLALIYLFRKAIHNAITEDPHQRQLLCKLLKTQVQTREGLCPVVGVLIAINVLNENEIFEERHIMGAIMQCLPHVKKIDGSYIVDRQGVEGIRLFYIEIMKRADEAFSIEEIKVLQKRLPRELKEGIGSTISPIFMPRNEEEVMRNILLLSQELKYIRDLPQVILSFDTQTEKELSFTVILLRILKPKDASIQEILHSASSPLKFTELEKKQVGKLRNKYPKEANVFKVKIDKKLFLRRDYSLDIFKARQAVSMELARILGDIRDFNGGIFSKQHEAFKALKEQIDQIDPRNDFLMENFFHSLSPTLMLNILPVKVLKEHFLLLKELLEFDISEHVILMRSETKGEYFHVMLASSNRAFKEGALKAVSHLNIPALDLASASVCVYQITYLGFLYRAENEISRDRFLHSIEESLPRGKILKKI